MSTMTIEQTVAILAKEYGFKKSDALKKLKKGDKPKRAKTGYNLFVADERHRIAVANPDDSTQEIMKKVGAAWKALEEAEREEWNNEARIAKTPDASSDEEMEVEEKKEKKEKKMNKLIYFYYKHITFEKSKATCTCAGFSISIHN